MDKDWTLSYLSSVAGQVTATSGEGDTARMFSWGAPNSSDYWMHYIIDDDGKQGIVIDDDCAPSNQMYSVIGYCDYHNIPFTLGYEMEEEENHGYN